MQSDDLALVKRYKDARKAIHIRGKRGTYHIIPEDIRHSAKPEVSMDFGLDITVIGDIEVVRILPMSDLLGENAMWRTYLRNSASVLDFSGPVACAKSKPLPHMSVNKTYSASPECLHRL